MFTPKPFQTKSLRVELYWSEKRKAISLGNWVATHSAVTSLSLINHSDVSTQMRNLGRFRISYTISFDFLRTVWWCPSCSIGNVWTFVELQLTALSALAPMQAYWGRFRQKLYRKSSYDPFQATSLSLQYKCSIT